MAGNRPKSTGIFHVLGQGWYVESPLGTKGPFVQRDLAEHYLEALTTVVESKDNLGSEGLQAVDRKLVVKPYYVGPERRVRRRRMIYDRRTRIRFETLKYPRRSDQDRRTALDNVEVNHRTDGT